MGPPTKIDFLSRPMSACESQFSQAFRYQRSIWQPKKNCYGPCKNYFVSTACMPYSFPQFHTNATHARPSPKAETQLDEEKREITLRSICDHGDISYITINQKASFDSTLKDRTTYSACVLISANYLTCRQMLK